MTYCAVRVGNIRDLDSYLPEFHPHSFLGITDMTFSVNDSRL